MRIKMALWWLIIVICSNTSLLISMEPPDHHVLSRAIKRGSEEAVREALDLGACPYTADSSGYPILYHAAMSHHPEIIRLLIRHGAPANVRFHPGSYNFTYNGALVTFNDCGSLLNKVISVYLISNCIYPSVALEKIKILLASGSPFEKDNELVVSVIKRFFAQQPFLLATILGDAAEVERLISLPPPPDQLADALTFAVGQGHTHIVGLLMPYLLLKQSVSQSQVQELLGNLKIIMPHCSSEESPHYQTIYRILTSVLPMIRNAPAMIGHRGLNVQRQ